MLKFDFTTYANSYIREDEIQAFLGNQETTKNKLYQDSMAGWLNPDLDPSLLNQLVETGNYIRTNSDLLLVIGIGGSFMGAYALDQMFRRYYNDSHFEVIYAGWNLSSDYLNDLLAYISDKRVTVNVISKSGTTMEPSLAYEKVMEVMHQKYSEDELKKRVIVTTDKEKGTLREEVNQKGYTSFVVPDNIGGRYSVLSPVGLLPLATIIDIRELLRGAKSAIRYIDQAYLYAVNRICLFNHHRYVENFVSYEPKMNYFLEWLKQLFGETEGKSNRGIFPTSTIYTRDLHSLGQFIQEGTPLLFETVLKVEEGTELLVAGRDMHEVNNITVDSVAKAHQVHTPTLMITLDRLDEYTIGEAIYFFMLSAAFSGYLFGVNPFDQPGVEAYKSEVRKNLKETTN